MIPEWGSVLNDITGFMTWYPKQSRGYKLISLHVRSMWETICDAQAGFWLNSKFLSKFSRKPLSGISDQKAPPNGKLQIWDDQSLLRNTPPMENFRFEMTRVNSEIPPNGKLHIWDNQSLLWNTPPMENFRFGMTKVYSEITPQWKTSDLGWPKFTPKYPPNGKLQIWDDQSLLRNTPPNGKLQIWDDQSLIRNNPPMENFRFGMTKVYSEIPPNGKLQIWDDQSLLWNIPPNGKLHIWDDQSLLWNTPPQHPLRLGIWEIVCGD